MQPNKSRNLKDTSAIKRLMNIPNDPATLTTRGGYYSPSLNVWISGELAQEYQKSSVERQAMLAAYSEMAISVGTIHRLQLEDAKNGRIWPKAWIDAKDGQTLVSVCQINPEAGSPYVQVRPDGSVVPFRIAYQEPLKEFRGALQKAMDSKAHSAEEQNCYLKSLHCALDPALTGAVDLDLMGDADKAWVKTPADIPTLVLSEFTESYSDPIKPHVANQNIVQDWAGQVAAQTGMAPWKFFFEMRVLEQNEEVVSQNDIQAIRKNNRRLYADLSDSLPSNNASFEFRWCLIVAGHGSNPPKSAKNYPNQAWIRSDLGYRNVVYSKQVEFSFIHETLPSVRAAFQTDWGKSADLEGRLRRAKGLLLVSHEETHPWCCFGEASWMEELKSDVLGMWSIINSEIDHNLVDLLITWVASSLRLHRFHTYHLARGDQQFKDYHDGDTVFMTHLMRAGFFQIEGGFVVDIKAERAKEAMETFYQRIIAIRRGEESIGDLYEDLYQGAKVFQKFRGWAEHQTYFEDLWG